MKKVKRSILILLFILGIGKLQAQNTTPVSTNRPEEPSATMTFKTQKLPNPLILKVNELTNGNEVLTEKVVAYIHQTNVAKIKRVVSESEYNLLSTDMKQEVIKESEVIRIINLLNN